MKSSPWREPGVLLAGGAVAAASVLFGAGVVRALSVDAPRSSAPRPSVERLVATSSSDSAKAERPDFMVAVENDPFLPERTAKPTRNRPGEPKASGDSLVVAAAQQDELIVLGVAMLPGGAGIAASRYAGESRLVRVGQQIGPYRLLRVEAGRAVFEGQNGVARTISVRKPES